MDYKKRFMDKIEDLKLQSVMNSKDAPNSTSPKVEYENAKRYKRFCDTIGKRFQAIDLEDYEIYDSKQSSVLDTCKEYISNLSKNKKKGNGITMIGHSGTGKTLFAYCIAKECILNGYRVEITPFHHIMMSIKESWGENAIGRESEIIRKYTNADFLFLEEVGVQYNKDTEKIILFDIFDQRYKNNKPTIFISNFNLKTLKTYIDLPGTNRVWDRMLEVNDILVFDWESYRGKKRNKNKGDKG